MGVEHPHSAPGHDVDGGSRRDGFLRGLRPVRSPRCPPRHPRRVPRGRRRRLRRHQRPHRLRHDTARPAANVGRPERGARVPRRHRRGVPAGEGRDARGHHRMRHPQRLPRHSRAQRHATRGRRAQGMDRVLHTTGARHPDAQGPGGGRVPRAHLLPQLQVVQHGLQRRHRRHVLHPAQAVQLHHRHTVLHV